MALNIMVCIKPVPDPEHYDKVTIDPVTKRITREGVPTIINPVDKCAIEKALLLKAQFGGKVTVMTMSMPIAEENLREALAMGADDAILLTDRPLGGADTLATSYTLAIAIEKLGNYDLIMTGAESADGATAQVSAQLGEWMNIPHLWNVFSAEPKDEKNYTFKTKFENGHVEWEGQLPMVLGVHRDIAKPRYVGAMGIIKAKSKPLTVWGRADLDKAEDKYLGLPGSPTKAGGVKSPNMKRSSIKLEGSLDEIAKEIVEKFRANGLIIG